MLKATPHKDRLTALRASYLHLFRHLAQISLDRRQPACTQFAQSDEKSDCVIRTQSLCGIALNDLVKCGIRRENVFVYDLHDEFEENIRNTFDVIYLCGGSPAYLLKRINENAFRNQLRDFISADGIVVGVSAGSIVFANNMPDNLGLLKCALDVHCNDEIREKAGVYDIDRKEPIKLGDRQAITFERNSIIVFE